MPGTSAPRNPAPDLCCVGAAAAADCAIMAPLPPLCWRAAPLIVAVDCVPDVLGMFGFECDALLIGAVRGISWRECP